MSNSFPCSSSSPQACHENSIYRRSTVGIWMLFVHLGGRNWSPTPSTKKSRRHVGEDQGRKEVRQKKIVGVLAVFVQWQSQSLMVTDGVTTLGQGDLTAKQPQRLGRQDHIRTVFDYVWSIAFLRNSWKHVQSSFAHLNHPLLSCFVPFWSEMAMNSSHLHGQIGPPPVRAVFAMAEVSNSLPKLAQIAGRGRPLGWLTRSKIPICSGTWLAGGSAAISLGVVLLALGKNFGPAAPMDSLPTSRALGYQGCMAPGFVSQSVVNHIALRWIFDGRARHPKIF